MMKLARLTLLLGIPAILLFPSCNVHKVTALLTVEDGAIPPQFGVDESTLLVVELGKRWHDKYLERHFKANYSGKYLLVTREELVSDQYADTTQYRFAFLSAYDVYPTGNSAYHAFAYSIMDRATDEPYGGGTTTFYGPYIKAYTKNLEAVQTKNRRQP